MPDELKARVAKARGIGISEVLGVREDGDELFAVTALGQEIRFGPDTPEEGEVLRGPGRPTVIVEPPPEIVPEGDGDVGALTEQPGYEVPAQIGLSDEGLPINEKGEIVALDEDDGGEVTHPDHFEVFKGTDGQFYFRRVAGNGEIVSSSEGYKRQRDALAEAEREAAGQLPVEIVKVETAE